MADAPRRTPWRKLACRRSRWGSGRWAPAWWSCSPTSSLDVAWREGVGIEVGIENSVAPSRVLLAVGLALVAMAPLRAALLTDGDRALRWPAAISAGLLAASLSGIGGYSPIVSPWLEEPEDIAADNGEVWLMDPDGGRQTRLVEAAPNLDLGLPVWSPDATRIAFTRFTGPADDPGGGDHDIWVANADGSEARPFATGPGWQWFPRWSPDGEWIAYTEEAAGGPWLSSGPVGPDVGQGPQGPVFPGANAPSRPEAELWLQAADGSGEPVRITNVAGDDRSSAWSPDGARLVFDSTRDGNTELYVVDADGSNPVRLTDEAGEDWAASWSPDGRTIAFTSDRSGLAQIWAIAPDGSGATQLTDDPIGALWPSWSPDGSRITYTGWETGRQQVWSMAADGSDRRNLSRSEATIDSVWDGSWGPDGRILFTRVAAGARVDSSRSPGTTSASSPCCSQRCSWRSSSACSLGRVRRSAAWRWRSESPRCSPRARSTPGGSCRGSSGRAGHRCPPAPRPDWASDRGRGRRGRPRAGGGRYGDGGGDDRDRLDADAGARRRDRGGHRRLGDRVPDRAPLVRARARGPGSARERGGRRPGGRHVT